MLVYARKDSSFDHSGGVTHETNGDVSMQAKPEIAIPPPRVLSLINALNAAHDEECESHAKRFERFSFSIIFDSQSLRQRKGGQTSI